MVSVRTRGRPTQYRIQIIFAVGLQVSNVGPWVDVQREVDSVVSAGLFRSREPEWQEGCKCETAARVGKRVGDEKLRVESKESKPRGVGGDGTNLHSIGIRDDLPLNGPKASQLYCIDFDRRKISEEC